MPSFFGDAVQNLWDLWYAILAQWDGLTFFTRAIIALILAGLMIYGGSKAETSGLSMIMFFFAFAFFAYVVTSGYLLIQ